jgi:hypothetical protein
MDAKLTRLKELIETKERVDRELAELLGEQPKQSRRGRPRKEKGQPEPAQSEPKLV